MYVLDDTTISAIITAIIAVLGGLGYIAKIKNALNLVTSKAQTTTNLLNTISNAMTDNKITPEETTKIMGILKEFKP